MSDDTRTRRQTRASNLKAAYEKRKSTLPQTLGRSNCAYGNERMKLAEKFTSACEWQESDGVSEYRVVTTESAVKMALAAIAQRRLVSKTHIVVAAAADYLARRVSVSSLPNVVPSINFSEVLSNRHRRIISLSLSTDFVRSFVANGRDGKFIPSSSSSSFCNHEQNYVDTNYKIIRPH